MHREYNHFWRQINVIYSSFLARILLKCSVNYSLYTLVIKKFKPTSNDLGTTTLIELRKKWKLSKFLQTETTEMVIRFTGWHFFFSFYSITYITEITFLIQDMWLVNINYSYPIKCNGLRLSYDVYEDLNFAALLRTFIAKNIFYV